MEKLFIKNKNGERIALLFEAAAAPRGIAVIMHGLGGEKDGGHENALAGAFVSTGFATVRFDARHTFGESDGQYEDATVTNYYEDLEDVIAWAQGRFPDSPLFLAGSSIGALCSALFVERHSDAVSGLVLTSTSVSGALHLAAMDPQKREDFQRTGWRSTPSVTVPGRIKRLRWACYEDYLRYDLLPDAGNIRMPVLMIAGEIDTSDPIAIQRLLFDAIPGPKKFRIIPGAPHTMRDPVHLAEMRRLAAEWLGGRGA